ncbi:hypothetical protein [Streptomyces subrutilus]|uniref:hypothetical protein n=1 Tax=Streptomyces subrutilus TaxID=36818 RepID=UPI002E165C7A|nr:hypothetical protein OG479_27050 [Streptomyces subrutilus]
MQDPRALPHQQPGRVPDGGRTEATPQPAAYRTEATPQPAALTGLGPGAVADS